MSISIIMRRVRVSSLQAPVHKLGDSQMKLTPKFRFGTVALSPTIPATADPNTSPEPPVQLIPGLPDDVALNCLLRLPVKSHLSCRLVCRQWHNLFSSKSHFFTLRKTLKLQSPYLFTLAYHRCTGKIEWRVFDLTQLSWHSIPAMPCRDHACPRGFGCVSFPEIGSLLVCGGLVSDMDCPLHLVLKYDVCKNKWTVLPPMLSARSFFGGGVIGGRVYVAGGYSTNQFELNSAEVYNPVKGMWDPVATMGIHMAASDSAVIDEKLYVTEGCAWPFFSSPRGRVYDPKPNKWESMATGMREGWTGLGAVYDNRLFVISEYEKMRVKVYDMESDMWDPVDGPPLPERVKKPFSVSCLERQGRIVVVGRGLHIAIGHVERCFDFSKSSCNKPFRKVNYAIRWEEVEAPHEFSDLTPSSCQILYA